MHIRLGVFAVLAVSSAPVFAQADTIADIACSGQTGEIKPQVLAEAILVSAGVTPTRLMAPATGWSESQFRERTLQVMIDPGKLDDVKLAGKVAVATQSVLEALEREDLKKKLVVEGLVKPATLDWVNIFSPDSKAKLRCVKDAAVQTNIASEAPAPEPKKKRQVTPILRKSVDEMVLASDKGIEGAGSFSFGFTRERSPTDAGELKTSTDVQINGAAGLAFGRIEADQNPIFAYGEYTLSEKRSKLDPPPAVPPTADPGADDVDVLELGLAFPSLQTFDLGPATVEMRARGGGVLDFAKNARRIFTNVQFEPGMAVSRNRSACGVGAFGRDIDIGLFTFRARCRFWLEADLSHVLKRGQSKLDDGDELLGLGGGVRLDLAPKLWAKRGLIASAQYRHLSVVSGTASDIDRVDFELGYRWLVGEALSIDVKTTYSRGEERKSYDNQDIWKIELGIKL